MAKRKRIGFILLFDNNSNSGIVNYIFNMISALNKIDDTFKPKILLIYSDKETIKEIKDIEYKYINYCKLTITPKNIIFSRLNNYFNKFLNINFYMWIKIYRKVDVLYPYLELVQNDVFKNFKNKLRWVVDFNSINFPEHYLDNAKNNNNYLEMISRNKLPIILSSETLKNEYFKIFKNGKNDIRVLKFASSVNKIDFNHINYVKLKYNIFDDYFICPNQFWEHKNQEIIIIALLNLKLKNIKCKVLFTGGMLVNRGKNLYSDKILALVKENKLEDYTMFLGNIDRKDQISLMYNSICFLQPSLYEGWSTLVEEAKAMNKFIILSDLPIHREQINTNVHFFNPCDTYDLENILIKYINEKPFIIATDYENSIIEFGHQILKVIN
ncbi:MAG: glycosyltransferase [Chitinophagaceae bacterium]|nr:glycosyltransferase [Chitinophagaceae bacterium]